ncbi:hypothetical protein F8388_005749 [Cannabis sativa]|uniref:Peptidase M48 domain-containing protein n=1 Tax=Cannabis sativa TaxID=3483 RepID=A0A7J6HP13_CANSA|nr:hypothetical protein F8388_005749 [Cannabis sativa]
MAYYRRAKLALDGFHRCGSKILSNAPLTQLPTSKISQTGSSILARNSAKLFGFCSYSTISQKSVSHMGLGRSKCNNPFLSGAKRCYYVDRYQVQHFRPRGPRRWFQNPRTVLIVAVVGSGALITVYFGNLESIPYTKRTHFVLLSRSMERRLGEAQFDQMKGAFKGKILPAIHPESVRVRLIANDIIKALQKGLRHEQVWSDLGYASESLGTPQEESGHDTLMALKESGGEGKVEEKWFRDDEILDDKWFEETRKKGQERGSQSATSHLEGLNWEVLVVDEPVVNAFCLPGGKIVVFTGLLEHFRSDAEIATIIGHEVGHAVARHAAEGITKNLWFAILQLVLYQFVMPDIVNTMSALFLRLPFSRRMETEADYIGLLLIASAGYDPRVAPKVYEKLGKVTGESALRDYLSTHPSGKKRALLLAQAKVMEEALTIYKNTRDGRGVEGQRLNLKNAILRLIEECKNMRELKQIHTQIIKSPFIQQTDQFLLTSRLLFFCAISHTGSLSYAADVFRVIENPNLHVYNIMIRAYASKDFGWDKTYSFKSLLLYKSMLCDGILPNCLTFPFLVKECAKRVDSGTGRSIHCQIIRYGFYEDTYVQNSLINLYSACGFLSTARVLFDEMLKRDVVSWNSIIVGYLRSGGLEEALDLFRMMNNKNIVTWNSIIGGFVQGGRPKEALQLFHEMQIVSSDMVRPDKFTLAGVLAACAHLGSIDHGKWVHNYMSRCGVECDVVIGTALVDMYGKCGSIERACMVFKEMPEKDTLAYTAMISVLALHGFSTEAFDLFGEMEMTGVKPNHVTFVGLLSACSHAGFVEKGRWCFDVMKRVHLIEPQVHHYACLVDILGRAGLFDEAERVIRDMPMKPDVFVWGALLGGCQMHGKEELGERVAKYLIDLEPLNHAFYVNLCDIYAKSCRFKDAKSIRTLMEDTGIKKEVVGCSMIEIDGMVHEFSVRGSPDVAMERLLRVLSVLYDDMKLDKYVCYHDGNYEVSVLS